MRRTLRVVSGLVMLVAIVATAREARAFCGFYVGGAGASLFNDATFVVLMRHGTRTVLSMQNDYQGPLKDFAMVVPVPVVLRRDDVKVIPRDVFARVDALASPRLVEYWEQDPCYEPRYDAMSSTQRDERIAGGGGMFDSVDLEAEVKVEARFTVGEYDVEVLSADDSAALDVWLRAHRYATPQGAAKLLRPYVEAGMKFFVAKVDVTKVAFDGGRATLSPLRFQYDSDAFFLPIRLGLASSSGTQDLIVTILAKNTRYEVANYDNVAIPTNLDVTDATRDHFGAMYAALFDETIANAPRAVVTEYAWPAGSCDPCPVDELGPSELLTLGADVLPVLDGEDEDDESARTRDFVATRLHARYTRDAAGDDLFFRAAHPVTGGREDYDEEGAVVRGARPSEANDFQARYVIRHPWSGDVKCEHPVRNVWGGPPGDEAWPLPIPSPNLGTAPRGTIRLADFLIDVPDGERLSRASATPPIVIAKNGGCAGCSATGSASAATIACAIAPLALFVGRITRRARRPRGCQGDACASK